MEKKSILANYNNERGVSAILIAILMFVFLGFAALALDIFHIVVAQNELKNAADAGALAGARFLYNDNGTAIDPGANLIGYNAARANRSEKLLVEVNLPNDNTGDVKRGHWSFATGEFTPNDSLEPTDLWGVSDDELDADLDFINAVEVTARREATPIVAYFARIFGIEGFQRTITSVAYIGFAGTLAPGDVDAPIAICSQSILYDDVYDCNIGRMLNSGSDPSTSNTGGWTNFSQDPCETANVPSLRPLICGSGNPDPVSLNGDMGAVNGVQDTIFRDLETCWMSIADSNGDGIPETTWELTLPVIDCPGNSISNCATLTGAVTLKVLWVQRDNPGYDQAPREMSDPATEVNWPIAEDLNMPAQDLEPYFVGDGPSDIFPSLPEGTTVGEVFDGSSEDSGRVRWASFVKRFNLRNVGPIESAPYATFAFKSIYFLPDCTPHDLAGLTGGHNYGVMARIPVLVE